MNRPRASILSLFDPLASSITPEFQTSREVCSPELSSSDKENSLPKDMDGSSDSPVTLTKFFTRTYTNHKPLPAPLLGGTLIDFEADDSDSDTQAHNDLEGISPYTSRKTIELEHTTVKRSPATPQRKVLAALAIEEDEKPHALHAFTPGFPAAPHTTIAHSFASPSSPPTLSPLSSYMHEVDGIPRPRTVTPPNSPPVISILPPPPDSPSPKRSHSGETLLYAQRHAALLPLDLHSSFNMNLRESSFDLLNDKITFVGGGSLLEEPEPDFHFDVDVTRGNVAALAKHFNVKKSADEKGASRGFRKSLGYDSDKDGLADIESDSEPENSSLVERLQDIRLDGQDVAEDSSETAAVIEALPPTTPISNFRGSPEPTPQAPHAHKFATAFTKVTSASVPYHLTMSESDATSFERKIVPLRKQQRSPKQLSPTIKPPATVPISALRIVKKGGSSVAIAHDDPSVPSLSNGSTSSSSVQSSTLASNAKSSLSKALPPVARRVSMVSSTSTSTRLRATARPSVVPELPIPTCSNVSLVSKASIVKYGAAAGRAAARSATTASATVARGSTSTLTGTPHVAAPTLSKARRTTGTVPTSISTTKASGLRRPSQFGTSTATSSTLPRAKPVAPRTSTAPPPSAATVGANPNGSDIARLLRGERPRQGLKRV